MQGSPAMRRESRYPYRKYPNKERTASEHSSRFPKEVLSWRSKSEPRENQRDLPPGRAHFEDNFLHDQAYEEFLTKVVCPFCLKVHKDKVSLVKHFSENCRSRVKKGMTFTIFQILPNNQIKCNFCPDMVTNCLRNYFFHSRKYHPSDSVMVDAEKDLPQFVFCSSCKIHVPANHTQLTCHLKHDIHNFRRYSMSTQYFLDKGINCIYCYQRGRNVFKCLSCPPPYFIFNSPLDILSHFKSSRHVSFLHKRSVIRGVNCCYCDEFVTEPDILEHFQSDGHMEKEYIITGEGQYNVCLYCGFASSFLRTLAAHMRSDCEEINKIREEIGLEMRAREDSATARKVKESEHKIKKERCILVKDDLDIFELMKTLKNFGKIVFVGPYDGQKMVVEFQNESAIEFISLVRHFIKVKGQKLDVEFLGAYA